MSQTKNSMIFDFSQETAVEQWRAIDDRIMGGRSESRPDYAPGVGLRFHGQVSLDNNGGFASIRSASDTRDLSAFHALRLRLRGDGKAYKLSLRNDRYFDGISYQAGFATERGVWQEIDLAFERFTPTHHGIELSTVAPLDPGKIESFGLFIADRQSGPFALDIAWVKAV